MNEAVTRPANSAPPSAPAASLEAIKTKQQAMWSSGDYAVVGTTLQIIGETLCEALDVRAGERVLDVAAGNGNATLAAARRFADVTSTDYVQALLDKGAQRAKADQLEVAFRVADVENLPFAAASFDVVLSSFGVMFAPDHERAAAQMLRVTRSGGRIGLANWTPDGFIGQLFKTVGKHVPPPPGVQSPALWGIEAHLRKLFGAQASSLGIARRTFAFRYRSAEHFIEVFRSLYGPVLKAFETLDGKGQKSLDDDLHTLLAGSNRDGEKSLIVDGEYLEAVVVKR